MVFLRFLFNLQCVREEISVWRFKGLTMTFLLESINSQRDRFDEQLIKYKIYSNVSSLEKTDVKISQRKKKEVKTRKGLFPFNRWRDPLILGGWKAIFLLDSQTFF